MTSKSPFGQMMRTYDEMVAKDSNDNYVINKPQMDEFIKVVEILKNAVKLYGGYMENIKLTPIEQHGDISCMFRLLALSGEELCEFTKALQSASAFTLIPAEDDMIILELKIPYIFLEKSEVQTMPSL